ncbi:palmitoyltransferase ZDHHC15-like [Daktulosphaira vitifoliae]|uniref:palmitoyltransferase ZDHHC15-like n=1 Tax=Daktulosphaira vitifoliae TaxID=58002 RepID=UPI0021AAA2A1|nr:palmitoyltransferase ZDHHC15-like [Daktulosphaira vitifoliae]
MIFQSNMFKNESIKIPNCIFIIIKKIPVVFVLCLLAWSYYVYIHHLCLGYIKIPEVKKSYILIYHIILVFFMWSYLKTIFTKPGEVPEKFKLPKDTFEKFNKHNNDLDGQRRVLTEFAKDLPISTVTNSNDVRFCVKCRVIKPDRSHHCSLCGKCVIKMDHHCPWVINCVSYSNYKFFVLFLIYNLLMNVFVVTTSLSFVLKYWKTTLNLETQEKPYKIHIILLFTIASLLSVTLFSMLVYHIYLLSKNCTTLESFRPPKFMESYDKNGFNLGFYRNIQEVFGKNILLWFIPLFTSLGDGVTFELNKKIPETQSLLYKDVYEKNTSYGYFY